MRLELVSPGSESRGKLKKNPIGHTLSIIESACACMENSMRHGISVYDSAYISLGQIREIPVYTADRRLMNRVGDERIRHISTY